MEKKVKAKKKAAPKRKRRRLTDPGMRFLDQMGRYMKTRGWSVLVAGPIGLVRSVGGRRDKHQLVIEFLGVEVSSSPTRQEP